MTGVSHSPDRFSITRAGASRRPRSPPSWRSSRSGANTQGRKTSDDLRLYFVDSNSVCQTSDDTFKEIGIGENFMS